MVNDSSKPIKNKGIDFILLGFSLLLLTYSVTRAANISFTFDESGSYINFVRKGIVIPTHFGGGDANNHLLNTWLMEFCSWIFGAGDFVLRLPNLFAHIIYLVYSAKLVKNLSSGILIICSFLLLNLNPYMIEFFALARGYGLSMGFMMASLYYAYIYLEKQQDYKAAFYSTFFASLAVLSYYILLNYFLIVTVLFYIVNMYEGKEDSWNLPMKKRFFSKKSLRIISPLLILTLIIPIMIHLKRAEAFSFGEDSGFWNGTVRSLIIVTFYYLPIVDRIIIPAFQFFIPFVLAFSALILSFSIRGGGYFHKHKYLIFLWIVFFLCFIANYLQHQLLGINYLRGRYALTYFILFMLLLIFSFNALRNRFSWIAKSLFMIIALVFVTNFLIAANISYTIDWRSEANIKDMMKYIIKNKKEDSPNRVNTLIGISFQMLTDINYYRSLYNLTWINVVNYEIPFSPLQDYFCIEKKDMDKLPAVPYKVIKDFTTTGSMVISNPQEWKSKEIYFKKLDFETQDNFNHLTNELAFSGKNSSMVDENSIYSDGFDYTIDDSLVNNNNALVLFKAMIYSKSLHADAFIVIKFEDNDQTISYQTVNIEDYLIKRNQWLPVYFTASVPANIKKGNVIKSYLWNVGKDKVYIDDMELKIMAYAK